MLDIIWSFLIFTNRIQQPGILLFHDIRNIACNCIEYLIVHRIGGDLGKVWINDEILKLGNSLVLALLI